MAATVIILAGMIGVGSLVGAIESWIEGIKPGTVSGESSIGSFGYALLLAIAMVLVAVDAAKSGHHMRTTLSSLAPAIEAGGFVRRRWWKSFRLILLLAIGPAVIALALATAPKAPHFEPQFTTNAAGVQVFSSYVKSSTDVPMVGELHLGQRLMIAGVFVITILAHGAAATSVGLEFATVKEWSRRTVLSVISLVLLVIVILPLCLLGFSSGYGTGNTMWSFVSASGSLLALLANRVSFDSHETLQAVMFWDAVVSLVTLGLWLRAIWLRQHRLRSLSEAKTAGLAEPKFSIEAQNG
jgi:hypothetical protein